MNVRELPAADTHLGYRAMLELRPHAGTLEEFVARVNHVQRLEGYRLVAAFADAGPDAVAVAGFRIVHSLSWGHAMYCDDLSTRTAQRRHGYANALFDWMIAEARRIGCDQFHLDSGVGPDREAAHRFYLGKRMRISAHHFAIML